MEDLKKAKWAGELEGEAHGLVKSEGGREEGSVDVGVFVYMYSSKRSRKKSEGKKKKKKKEAEAKKEEKKDMKRPLAYLYQKAPQIQKYTWK